MRICIVSLQSHVGVLSNSCSVYFHFLSHTAFWICSWNSQLFYFVFTTSSYNHLFFFFLKSHHIRYLSNESLLSLLPQLQKVSTSTFCFIWGCCSPVLLSWDHPRLLSWVCNHHFLNFMSFYFLVLLEAHFLSLFWLKMFFFYSLPHT